MAQYAFDWVGNAPRTRGVGMLTRLVWDAAVCLSNQKNEAQEAQECQIAAIYRLEFMTEQDVIDSFAYLHVADIL